MSDINVDWAAAPVDRDYTAAALEGAQAGQAQRGISALQGIDINNPDSLNKGIANLVRAGAADQASALMGLQINRSLYGQLPSVLERLSHLGQHGAPAAAEQPATQAPDPSAASADLNTQLASDIRTYKQTPPDQQPALLANLKQKYLDAKVPEAAIDAKIAEVTSGDADQHADHHDAHAALLSGGQPNQAALAPPTGRYGWTQDLLSDPGLIGALNMYKRPGIGLDLTGLVGTAQAIAAPEIAAQATEAHAGNIARENFMGSNPTVPVMINGVKHDIPTPDALALYHNPSAIALGFGKGPELGQEAGAAAAATAPSRLTTLPGKGGTEQPGTFYPGKDGVWAFHPAQVASPTGGMTTAPATSSPGEVDRFTKSNQQYVADQQIVSGSNARLTVLKTVEHLLESPEGKTGPGTQAVNGMKSFLLAQAPSVLAQIDGGLDKAKLAIATQDKLHKYMVQAAGLSAAQYGQGTNEKLAFAASGNANNDISTLANKDVTRVNIALERANQAKLDAFQKTGQSGDHYSDFSANWGSTIDPRAFMLDMLSKSERLKLQDTIKTGPEQQAYARGVRAAIAAKIYSRADIK